MNNKTIILSRRGILLATLAGFFASSYLLYTYTTGADLKCGSLVHGCDVVRLSEWASMFGIPTPVFGVIFYLAVLIILIVRAYAPQYKPGLARLGQLIFGVAGFAESAFLVYIQAFVIGQFCSWCLVSAISATTIFILIFFDRKYTLEKTESIRELKFISITLAAFFVIGGLLFFWLIRPTEAPPISPIFNQNQNTLQESNATSSAGDPIYFHKEPNINEQAESITSNASTSLNGTASTATVLDDSEE